MFEEIANPGALRPQELEAVYGISRAVAKAVDQETALDEITQVARKVFIFDNIVLYEQRETGNLEPTYARAIGRGRFREADLAWGEYTANDAFQAGKNVLRVEDAQDAKDDRTGARYLLGLPLNLEKQAKGALIFIRFGGPDYPPDQIHLAEYIALHVAQLLEHRQLVERVASLEARRRLDNLQDDFIAMISHELLTPLGFIKGYATTLLREDITWDDSTRREFLGIIDEESDRLRELIDNLMDSSRLQAGTLQINFQPTRLDTLLKDIILRASSRDDHVKIDLQLNAPGMQIQADPTRLAQVFDNLLTNAAKYAPGSPVTIRMEKVDQQVRISVRDRGPGIPAEHLSHLFKRFYRVPGPQTSVRGTGLGLYICNQIIQAHHGEIKAESTVGKGTVFYIFLPCENQIVERSSNQEANR
jgi:signal transduction histidine kinase